MKTKLISLFLLLSLLTSCTLAPADATVGDIEEISPPEETAQDTVQGTETTEETETAEAVKEIPAALQNNKITLRFDENGEFKVLVFGDVQCWSNGPDANTLAAIATITEREDPDLVLFAGDNSSGCSMDVFLERYLQRMAGYMEENEIPWAHVYGNHDEDQAILREDQQKVYESFAYCVSKTGPEDIKGVANYVLPVYSSDESRTDPVFAIWGMDTGNYCVDEGLAGMDAVMPTGTFPGYGYMTFSQVDWYYDTSVEIEEYVGHKVPGLLCIHIPLQEYAVVLANRGEESVEFEGRGYSVGAGPINSGMFSAMVERGDIKAVVAGHDHVNTFAGKYCGINLTYATRIGDESVRAGRVFVIHEDNPEEIETYQSFLYGADLASLTRAMVFDADFENAEEYSLTDGLTIQEGAGLEGSCGLVVAGEGTVTLSKPYTMEKVEYVKFWTSVPAGSRLVSFSVNDLETPYTADLTAESISLLAQGASDWTELAAGEGIPEGFVGQVAVKLDAFRNANGTPLTSAARLLGYAVAAEGSVTLDQIDCDNNR